MSAEFFQWLSAAGDVGTLGMFFVLWHFDRRVFRLELKAGFVKN